MTTYPAWTPASRPGIIPLHPLSFGTILGRSFAALRQNPKVLLGFALCVQAVAYLVVLVAVGAVGWASFSRLDTLTPGSEDYDAVMAGSIALTAIAGIVLGLAAGALGVIVQGVVVAEVAHAALAEKLTLGALWRRVKPVAWRLLGYSFLLVLATLALVAVGGVVVFATGTVAPPAAIALFLLLGLGAVPLTLWLTVKLLLAPSAIILEHATIGGAIGRSWRLTRGRFWPALGIVVIVSLIFGAIAQVVGLPFQLITTGLTSIIAPTGDPGPTDVIGLIVSLLLVQAVTLLIQSVGSVVQSTSTALIYLDCRMRHEGLDLDMLSYVERRDAGVTGLPDPYREHIGRVLVPRLAPPPPMAGYAAYPPYSPYVQPQPYSQYSQSYPPSAQPQQYPQYPQPYAAAPAAAAPTPPVPSAEGDVAAPPAGESPPSATRWTAPDAAADRESPWA
ncbi:glycerophosphoryl diester phosphodiesterase membrane domain-containing protein [Microbacterium sp. P5_E9]